MVVLCQGPQVSADAGPSQVQTPPATPDSEAEDVIMVKPPPVETSKTLKAPKAPKAPKTPKAPKAPKAPKEPKEPKAPKAPRAPRAPKAPKEPKEPKAPRAPREPKARLPGQRGPGRPRKVIHISAPVWYCCACQGGPWLEPTTPACIDCCHATCDGCTVTDVMPTHYYEVEIMQEAMSH